METNNAKGNLLIVDDEETFLNILERIFKKHYNVKSALSGEKALAILEQGFPAEVIMSDQKMPGMSGAEFLEKSMALMPNATRIILTGFNSPKDIIPCINQGHAYMYISKPAEELELIQAVKVAFDYYQSNTKSKKLLVELNQKIKSLNDKNEKLATLLKENHGVFSQAVQALAGILHTSEKFYFTSHAKNVAVISKALAESLNFEEASLPVIVLTSLLHTAAFCEMPEKFVLMEPHELDETERTKYFELFTKGIEHLQKISLLSKHTKIMAQLWERHDGSGYPKGVSGNDIFKEAQIIYLAHFYHNSVYRVPAELIPTLKEQGSLEQDSETTKKRHTECIKILYKRAAWFDIDIFNAFQDLIKTKKCAPLVPPDISITAYFADTDPKRPVIAEKAAEDEKIEETAKIDSPENTPNAKKIKMIDKEIPFEDLEAGMTVSHNIATKAGHLIVRQETVLTDALVKQLNQYFQTGMLSGDKVYIMVPKGE